MADLQAALAEAVKLNQHITQFLKFSTYPEYSDLSGLDIDFQDGEQLLIWDELRRITEQLADVQEYISYLTRPVTEESRLRKGTAGKYQTAKGYYYDCGIQVVSEAENQAQVRTGGAGGPKDRPA